MSTLKAVASELAVSSPRLAPAAGKFRKVTRIALVGPDGVGKSTTIALLNTCFQREFPANRFHVRQWRPGLLPDLGRLIGKRAASTKAVRPRRKPGRVHWVRVFYYYWDFLLGSWWQDRVNTKPGALVIYDRCALDMQVDPVRFGLRSALGTRLLAWLSPRPQLVILLEDTPERIWERKREIQQYEMREQLDRWRELAEAGQVHAILRVDDGPEVIAHRIWQLILEAMTQEPPRNSDRTMGTGLESLVHLVHGATQNSDGKSEFLILPARQCPRFLAPLSPRRAAANSLEIYNPQTRRGRVWRRSSSIALRTGFGQRFFKDRVILPLDDLQRYLARAVGCEQAVVSVSLGTPGVHRKPVFQVMDTSGRIRAFAKAGWNHPTNELVSREAAALASLGQHVFSTAKTPRVLNAGWYRSNYVIVMDASGDGSRPCSHRLDDRHIQFLAELHRIKAGTAGVLPLHAVAARIPEIRDAGQHYYAHVLQCAVEHPTDGLNDADLPTGFAHGDFAPWNIRTAGDRLLVLDWEYCGNGVPAGWDLFHFLIHSAIELKRHSGADVYRSFTRDSANRAWVQKYFDSLGISRQWIRPSLIAYLAETLSSNLTRSGNNCSPIDRAARRTCATMLNLVLRAKGGVL